MKVYVAILMALLALLWVAGRPVAAEAVVPTTTYLPIIEYYSSCRGVTQIPSDECEALVSLYVHTAGHKSGLVGSWLTTNQPCSWFGVTCEDGHVTSLFLQYCHPRFGGCSGVGLAGTLPPQIGDMPALRYLDLAHNQISGSIPPSIGNLQALSSLNLSDNALSGAIPAEMGNLKNLTTLVLTYNQLTGSIPTAFGNMERLVSLRLDENQLTGSIPADLGKLITLRSLLLRENQLTGPLPPEMGNLKYLIELDLGGNAPSLCVPPALTAFVQGLWQYVPPPGAFCAESTIAARTTLQP